MTKRMENSGVFIAEKYKNFNPHLCLTNRKFSEIIGRNTVGHYQYQKGVFLYMMAGTSPEVLRFPLELFVARIKEIVMYKERAVKVEYSNFFYTANVSKHDVNLYLSPKFKTYLEALLFVYEKEKR